METDISSIPSNHRLITHNRTAPASFALWAPLVAKKSPNGPLCCRPAQGADERDPSPRRRTITPTSPPPTCCLHILAHLPNLEGARWVAERSTFANVRRT